MIFHQKYMYLRSDFELIINASSSCLAHAQCATIRMNTVYVLLGVSTPNTRITHEISGFGGDINDENAN